MMAILLLFLSLPTTVEASSQSYSQRRVFTETEVRQKIAAAFPNYLNEMQEAATLQTQNTIQDDADAQMVDYEVRSLSDNERVTHIAYSNNRSLYIYDVNTYTNSSSSGTGYLRVNTDVYMTVVGYFGMMQIFGFEYVLVQDGYDCISSFGSVANSWVHTDIREGPSTESAAGGAYGYYDGDFESDHFTSRIDSITLQITVGGDACTYEIP